MLRREPNAPDTGACMRSACSYSECACCVQFRAARRVSSGKEEQRRRPASDAMPPEEKQVWRDSVVCPQQTDERWRTSEQETDVDHLHDKRLGDTDEVIAEQLQRAMNLSKNDKAAIDRARSACFIVAVASRGRDKQGTGTQGGDRLLSGQGHEEEQRVLSRGSPFRVPQLTGFNYQSHGSELRDATGSVPACIGLASLCYAVLAGVTHRLRKAE